MFRDTLYGHSYWPAQLKPQPWPVQCSQLINETLPSHVARCLFAILRLHRLHLVQIPFSYIINITFHVRGKLCISREINFLEKKQTFN